MKIKKFAILDYGIGNFGSLKGMLNKIGHNVYIGNNYKDLEKADFLILPGVGAFPSAINIIKKNHLDKSLRKLKTQSKPMLGICLGMHLLTTSSEELGFNKGLSFIPGNTKQNLKKAHHIGWSKLNFIDKKNDFFKFNGTDFYDKSKVVSIIQKKNIVGVQFHPEKSQDNGLEFFKKYIDVFK